MSWWGVIPFIGSLVGIAVVAILVARHWAAQDRELGIGIDTDAEADAEVRWSITGALEDADGGVGAPVNDHALASAATAHVDAAQRVPIHQDPLTGEGLAMLTGEDLGRILEALEQEAAKVRGLVERARDSLSVEDYGEALAGALNRQATVLNCLADLRRAVGGVPVSEQARKLATWPRVWFVYGLADADGGVGGPSTDHALASAATCAADRSSEGTRQGIHAPLEGFDHALASAGTVNTDAAQHVPTMKEAA